MIHSKGVVIATPFVVLLFTFTFYCIIIIIPTTLTDGGGAMQLLVFWLCVMGVAMLIEMLTSTYITMWFAIGGLFAIFFNLLHISWVVQLIAFLVVSLLLLFFVRNLFTEFMETGKFHIRTLEEKMLSRQGVATVDINSQEGSIFIDGKLMKAKIPAEEESLVKGTVVEVIAVEQGILVVKEASKVKEDEGTLIGNAKKKFIPKKKKKKVKKENDEE